VGGWPVCALARSCPTLMRMPVRRFGACQRAGTDPCFSDIFGVPLNESVLRASATAILGGYRHDLPLVVFLCVEELYRTGEYELSMDLWFHDGAFL